LTLRTHMRMSGSWHLYRPGEGWQRARSRARIRIDTPEWVAVAFDVYDAEFLTDAALAVHHTLARLGPDLLSPQFDRADVLRRLAARGRQPIAEALLDQRLTAGIGNVFKSEILFLCGIAPSRPVDSLGDADREALIDTARRALSINVVGGTMRRTTGRDRPGERLWVYGRAGRPCRRCGTLIRSAKTGLDARSTYWCPACQPA
jgi:endonuclease-8